MDSPADLRLDCKPHSYSTLLKSFGDQTDQTQKLEDFLSRLEEERLKIDAFKRELPLCMHLLNNEMEASRQQLQTFRTNQGPRLVLEEFIPLKNSSSEGSEKASNVSEKVSWLTTAQLWSTSNDGSKQHEQGATTAPKDQIDQGSAMSPKLGLDNKQRNGRGAFLPFSKERNTCTGPTLRALPELALVTTEKEMEEKKCSEPDNGMSCLSRSENPSKGGNGGTTTEQSKGSANNHGEAQATNTTQAAHRKARRSWSPDLHRRFVNALQMLGGSQVATPKQIRELMKVDGLTNDEVKSHLQKYRLHTRRPSPSPQAAGAAGPQLVVLGGIWVPPEYATAATAHTAGTAIYSAHPASHASIHYGTPAVPQDFYPHHPQLPHTLQPHLHQHHLYKASSATHSSPESDGRPIGDGSESIEDGKSESSSWNKGESGENGGGGERERERERVKERERKGLASLRDDGEESNGSDITLKF